MHLAALKDDVPDTFLRALKFLSLRHQQANTLLMNSLDYVLSLLAEEGIPCLVLKGAALCRSLYPAIGLRPMRDIDLLLAKKDVQHAHALLQKKGFRASTDPLPEGYFHLPPLFKSVEGMQVCLELHHGLFPDDPPYYNRPCHSFAQLYRNGQLLEGDGVKAYTLAREEMLWHLYQHGLHAPLTYEPYRLISVADIVGLVEANVATLDWEKIAAIYPQLFRALPLLHYLTPWHDTVLEKIPFKKRAAPSGVGASFNGWPRVKFVWQKKKGICEILGRTLVPPQWWVMLYYSTGLDIVALIWARIVRHPLHILRWLKIRATTR